MHGEAGEHVPRHVVVAKKQDSVIALTQHHYTVEESVVEIKQIVKIAISRNV